MSANRRELFCLVAGGAALLAAPAWATPEERDEAIRRFAGTAEIRDGRVKLDIPPLIENGNSAPLTVAVESPMTEAEHVRRIGIFNEANPQPHVITVMLGPHSGHAKLATRIRLATSQRIMALAELSDGTVWRGSADVIVTLAACVEGVMARALVNVPKTARSGDIVEVRTLISHEMETGYRPGPNGRILPRNIITHFTCVYDEKTVFEAELSPAMSANPYLVFPVRVSKSGPLTLTWTGDNGFEQVETASIEVT